MEAVRKNIVFVSSGLHVFGGLESVTVATANLLVSHNYKVSIIVISNSPVSVFPLHPQIVIKNIDLTFGISQAGNLLSRKVKLIKDFSLLRNEVSLLQPDTVICNEYSFSIALALDRKRKYKLFSWEHAHFSPDKKNWFWSLLTKVAYKKLDGIICLNEDEKRLYQKYNDNVFCIPNFFQYKNTSICAHKKTNQILSVTRLTEAKGIHTLLQVSKLILEKNEKWQWKIIGTGHLQNLILTFIDEHKLHGRLILESASTHNLWAEYEQSSIYVMTSLHEGFGMVLLEALTCGTPCIAFDCETGPRHIIKNGENGKLIPLGNLEELREAISFMIQNEVDRHRMSALAPESVAKFQVENIFPLWQKLVK
jgi:glycosyltransferase involved in cell wall biosynthesis